MSTVSAFLLGELSTVVIRGCRCCVRLVVCGRWIPKGILFGVIQVIVTHEDNKEEREKGMTVMVRTLLSRVRTFPAKLGAHVS